MFAKMREIEERFDFLESELGRPEIIKDQPIYQKYLKEHSSLWPIVTGFRTYESIQQEIESNRPLLDDPDPEMKKLAKEEIELLNSRLEELEKELKILLLPKDPNEAINLANEPSDNGVSPKVTEKVFTSLLLTSFINDTTELESTPPLRKAPSGTSLINLLRIEFFKSLYSTKPNLSQV